MPFKKFNHFFTGQGLGLRCFLGISHIAKIIHFYAT